jgi:death-on-curing protein
VNIEFLTLETVRKIHTESLDRYGGLTGIRSQELLESAVAQPEATFDGVYLHEDIFMMAAAYLFHLVSNHPFLDGNKRTGLGCALAFLDGNGVSIEEGTRQLYEATMAVAEARMGKDQLADVFRKLGSH